MSNHDDPTRMSDQPALTTSSGRVWMIVGTVLVIVCVGVLIALLPVHAGVAITGAVIDVVAYAAMWVARVAVRQKRARLLTLAILFGVITATTLVCALIISGGAWLVVAR
jgi:hypothetical protein